MGNLRRSVRRNLLAPSVNACVVRLMSHCKGKNNVKTRNARRKKMERLQAAKKSETQATAQAK